MIDVAESVRNCGCAAMEEAIHKLSPNVFWRNCAQDDAKCRLLNMRSQEAVLEVPASYEHMDPRTGAAVTADKKIRLYVQRFMKDRERPRAHVICLSGGPGMPGRDYDTFIADMAYFASFPMAFYTIDHRGLGRSEPFADASADQWPGNADALAASSAIPAHHMTLTNAAMDVGMFAHALLRAARREWPDPPLPGEASLPTMRLTLYGVSYGAQLAHHTVALLPNTFDYAFIIGVPMWDSLGSIGTHLGLAENCAASKKCCELLGCAPQDMLRTIDSMLRDVTDPERNSGNECVRMLLDEAGVTDAERKTQGGTMLGLQRYMLPLMKNNSAVTQQKRGIQPSQLVLSIYTAADTCSNPKTFEEDVLAAMRPFLPSARRDKRASYTTDSSRQSHADMQAIGDVGPMVKGPSPSLGAPARWDGLIARWMHDASNLARSVVRIPPLANILRSAGSLLDAGAVEAHRPDAPASGSVVHRDAPATERGIAGALPRPEDLLIKGTDYRQPRHQDMCRAPDGHRDTLVKGDAQQPGNGPQSPARKDPNPAKFGTVANAMIILNTDYNFNALGDGLLPEVVADTNLFPGQPYRATYYERFKALESVVRNARRTEQHALRTARTTVVVSQSRMDMITPYDPAWRAYTTMECPRRYWMLFDHRGHDGNWGDCLRRAVHAVLFSTPRIMEEMGRCLAKENYEQHLEWDFPQHPSYAQIWRNAGSALQTVSADMSEAQRIAADKNPKPDVASIDSGAIARVPSYHHDEGPSSKMRDVYPPLAALPARYLPGRDSRLAVQETLSIVVLASVAVSAAVLFAAVLFFFYSCIRKSSSGARLST